MSSPVEQLQADAVDPGGRVSDLVRKAKLVASKLDLPELEKWADAELGGYADRESVPRYRHVQGTPIWLNPHRGWLPINFVGGGVRWAKQMSETEISQPISEIEALVARGQQDGEGALHSPFGAELVEMICQSMGVSPTQVVLRVDQAQLIGIIDVVRNGVLEWSLKLEKAGILGQGIAFSHAEKEKAHQGSVLYQIGSIAHFAGNLGPASGHSTIAPVQKNSNIAPPSLSEMLAYLRQQGMSLNLTPKDQTEFEAAIAEAEAASGPGQPDPGRIARALTSLRGLASQTTNKVAEITINALLDRYLGPTP
jgi:hypothetical protein